MTKEHAVLMWDGRPQNFISVCIQSLRNVNPNCVIWVHYRDEYFKQNISTSNVRFKRLDESLWQNRRLAHRLELLLDLAMSDPDGSRILYLDPDLFFQRDPFSMMDEYPGGDLYYTTTVMQTEYVGSSVNAGVYGVVASPRSRQLLGFMLDNIKSPSWSFWEDYPLQLAHQEQGNAHWFSDQDFLNCIHHHRLPFDVVTKNVGYKYNYYTSKIGFYNPELEMNNKIGDSDYAVIHWKGFWQSFYNIENPRIYNLANLKAKRRLHRWRNRRSLKKKIDARRVGGKYPWL